MNRTALSAAFHCLVDCSIGEALGHPNPVPMIWGQWKTIVLAVGLAFFFGYLLTILPLLRGAIALTIPLGVYEQR